MKRPLHINLDVDDVLADFVGELLHDYNIDYGDTLCPEDLTDWDLTKCVKPECGRKIYDLIIPDLFRRVKPIPYARTTVQLLRALGHRVVFVTSCINGTDVAKRRWLEHYGFLSDHKDFIPTSDKSLIRGDLLVDDAIHNVEPYPDHAVLVTQPWNLASKLPRIASIADLPAYITRLQEETPYRL